MKKLIGVTALVRRPGHACRGERVAEPVDQSLRVRRQPFRRRQQRAGQPGLCRSRRGVSAAAVLQRAILERPRGSRIPVAKLQPGQQQLQAVVGWRHQLRDRRRDHGAAKLQRDYQHRSGPAEAGLPRQAQRLGVADLCQSGSVVRSGDFAVRSLAVSERRVLCQPDGSLPGTVPGSPRRGRTWWPTALPTS